MQPLTLRLVLLGAFLRRTPGLSALTQRYSTLLGTTHKSTLSYCLRRPTFVALVQALMGCLEQSCQPAAGQMVALDSMPTTLRATLRHGCRKLNRNTVGGGVLWEVWLDAPPGACPVHLLRLIGGAWHDTQSVADAPLRAAGPLYLMDLGFWAIDLVCQWLAQGVHFILRANPQDFCFTRKKTFSRPRTLEEGRLKLKVDALATLGGGQRKNKPLVRLVWVWLVDKQEELILVSDQLAWSAEQILAAYQRRGEIEQFHRVLKDLLGLAHLYSFQELGVVLLLHVVVLLATLLLMVWPPEAGRTVLERLRRAVAQARWNLPMDPGVWRRNMLDTHQNRGSKRRRRSGDSQHGRVGKHQNH